MVSAVEQIREILAADLHGRFIHLQRNEDDGQLEYVSLSDENKRDTLGFVKDGLDPCGAHSLAAASYVPDLILRRRPGISGTRVFSSPMRASCRNRNGSDDGGPAKGRFYILDMRILEEAAGTGPREVS